MTAKGQAQTHPFLQVQLTDGTELGMSLWIIPQTSDRIFQDHPDQGDPVSTELVVGTNTAVAQFHGHSHVSSIDRKSLSSAKASSGVDAIFDLDSELQDRQAVISHLKEHTQELESKFRTVSGEHKSCARTIDALERSLHAACNDRDMAKQNAEQTQKWSQTTLNDRKRAHLKLIDSTKKLEQKHKATERAHRQLMEDHEKLKSRAENELGRVQDLKTENARLQASARDVEHKMARQQNELQDLNVQLVAARETVADHEATIAALRLTDKQYASIMAEMTRAIDDSIEQNQPHAEDIGKRAYALVSDVYRFSHDVFTQKTDAVKKVLEAGCTRMEAVPYHGHHHDNHAIEHDISSPSVSPISDPPPSPNHRLSTPRIHLPRLRPTLRAIEDGLVQDDDNESDTIVVSVETHDTFPTVTFQLPTSVTATNPPSLPPAPGQPRPTSQPSSASLPRKRQRDESPPAAEIQRDQSARAQRVGVGRDAEPESESDEEPLILTRRRMKKRVC